MGRGAAERRKQKRKGGLQQTLGKSSDESASKERKLAHGRSKSASKKAPFPSEKKNTSRTPRGEQNARIYRQAATALTRLLEADASKRGGVSLKSLTLAPGNVAKKATHALTCETLKHLAVLKEVTVGAGLLHAPEIPGQEGKKKGKPRGKKEHNKGEQGQAGNEGRRGQPWPELVYVVAYDVLFGKGQAAAAAGASGTFKAVLGRRTALKAGLARLMVKKGAQSVGELIGGGASGGQGEGTEGLDSLAKRFPRYARVNTLKATSEVAMAQFPVKEAGESAGAVNHENGAKNVEGAGKGPEASGKHALISADLRGGEEGHAGAKKGARPSDLSVQVDAYIPDVLRFAAGTDLHAHPLVSSGQLILQGWASCLPAFVLGPTPGSHVLDACAAPGNKTTHLAALMQGQGRITACERNRQRAELLRATVARAGAEGMVTVLVRDFLQLDTSAPEFADATCVLVDPSCSGSGTVVTRMDHLLPSSQDAAKKSGQGSEVGEARKEISGKDTEIELDKEGGEILPNGNNDGADARLEKLASFQEAALRHALSFPSAERVVYSTCSIEERENEEVVARVLPLAEELGFYLDKAVPLWPRRGAPSFSFAPLVVRTDPEKDLVEGFFVALFARKKHGAIAQVALDTELDSGEHDESRRKRNNKKKKKTNKLE